MIESIKDIKMVGIIPVLFILFSGQLLIMAAIVYRRNKDKKS